MKERMFIPNRNHLRGLKKLLPYFETQTSIAYTLGVSKQLVNDWFRGRIVIHHSYAIRLEKMLQKRVTLFDLRPDLEKKSKKGCKR
jgi:DNA-binding transcriptional regulator YdaS (Cro superfamily)